MAGKFYVVTLRATACHLRVTRVSHACHMRVTCVSVCQNNSRSLHAMIDLQCHWVSGLGKGYNLGWPTTPFVCICGTTANWTHTHTNTRTHGSGNELVVWVRSLAWTNGVFVDPRPAKGVFAMAKTVVQVCSNKRPL